MSDASDAVAEALARTKRLAASRLVRKQELEAELRQRREERSSLDSMGDGAEVLALKQELDVRVQTLTTELAAVSADLSAAVAEITDLGKLAGTQRVAAARKVVESATDSDPLIRTPEETALDNVRTQLADLQAQVRLSDELAGRSSPMASPATPASPSSAEAQADADAQALAEFQALRGKPKKTL
jgi:hypothetical protein